MLFMEFIREYFFTSIEQSIDTFRFGIESYQQLKENQAHRKDVHFMIVFVAFHLNFKVQFRETT